MLAQLEASEQQTKPPQGGFRNSVEQIMPVRRFLNSAEQTIPVRRFLNSVDALTPVPVNSSWDGFSHRVETYIKEFDDNHDHMFSHRKRQILKRVERQYKEKLTEAIATPEANTSTDEQVQGEVLEQLREELERNLEQIRVAERGVRDFFSDIRNIDRIEYGKLMPVFIRMRTVEETFDETHYNNLDGLEFLLSKLLDLENMGWFREVAKDRPITNCEVILMQLTLKIIKLMVDKNYHRDLSTSTLTEMVEKIIRINEKGTCKYKYLKERCKRGIKYLIDKKLDEESDGDGLSEDDFSFQETTQGTPSTRTGRSIRSASHSVTRSSTRVGAYSEGDRDRRIYTQIESEFWNNDIDEIETFEEWQEAVSRDGFSHWVEAYQYLDKLENIILSSRKKEKKIILDYLQSQVEARNQTFEQVFENENTNIKFLFLQKLTMTAGNEEQMKSIQRTSQYTIKSSRMNWTSKLRGTNKNQTLSETEVRELRTAYV